MDDQKFRIGSLKVWCPMAASFIVEVLLSLYIQMLPYRVSGFAFWLAGAATLASLPITVFGFICGTLVLAKTLKVSQKLATRVSIILALLVYVCLTVMLNLAGSGQPHSIYNDNHASHYHRSKRGRRKKGQVSVLTIDTFAVFPKELLMPRRNGSPMKARVNR